MTQEERRDRFRDGFARWNDMTREERRELRGSFARAVLLRPGSCG